MDKTEMIKVVIAEPGKKARIAEIEHTLENLQKTVEGYIECIYPFEDSVGVIDNEEGKLIGLEPNRVMYDDDGNMVDVIFGTFIIAGLAGENFGSLTDAQAEKYLEMFRDPEVILHTKNGLVVFKLDK